ncbi:MAG: HipA N-terminal domain-containing protein, partial [Paludibacterium sp.]|nr:HipA N-terminal domain-containing protein [Paludibacterium sp.]
MTEAHRLNVFWNETRIASLAEQGSIWRLQYDRAWLDDPRCFAISPALPLQVDAHVDGASV